MWRIQFALAGGESLTITLVPVQYSAFVPPANFPSEKCIPFADLSINSPNLASDVCGTFQADCSIGSATVNDCNSLFYTLLESYDLPPNLSAVGGPDFLVVHGSGCPTSSTALAQSIFTDYFVTRQDPSTKGSGSGTGSCFEVTYTPGAPAITGGSVSRFVGWQSPVVNTDLNQVKAGSTRPLIFNFNDNAGNPIPNLNYCANTSGTGCTVPWVNLASFGIRCPSGAPVNPAPDGSRIDSSGNSGFQNNGGGNYQVNWKIPKSWKGSCADVQATFDNGIVEVPAVMGFQFN